MTEEHAMYASPFSWRYGSREMRHIWGELHKRRLWRRIWQTLAEAQSAYGLVSAEQLMDIRAHVDEVDMVRAHELEVEIQHDLMAELRTFAEQCPLGGAVLHLGATSMDIEDNAEVLRLRESLELLTTRLQHLLLVLADQVETWADTPCMAYTHLQPAEPTTVGYRLAQYAQDLLIDFEEVRRVGAGLRGKGLKGAVGTAAAYVQLVGNEDAARELEKRFMAGLGLLFFPVATQTYPRKQDWLVLNALAGTAGSLYKFAFDLRLLQSPAWGEWAEPFGERQVGSSAMPFKRNPIHAENMDSLGRLVAALPRVAWDNAAHSLLERTLDDSANRRVVLAEAFLAVDEMLLRALRLVEGLRVDETALERGLTSFGVFAATERLLMEMVKAGADRQAAHELIREHSMQAWETVRSGEPNPLQAMLANDTEVTRFVPRERIMALLRAEGYVGLAPGLARDMAEMARRQVV
jgi:adenylosuccinate lyase